jgi:hypothetical protein
MELEKPKLNWRICYTYIFFVMFRVVFREEITYEDDDVLNSMGSMPHITDMFLHETNRRCNMWKTILVHFFILNMFRYSSSSDCNNILCE